MIVRLLQLYNAEGPLEEMAEMLIDRHRVGLATGALVVADIVKAVPLVGWVIGGLATGLGCNHQTRLLGQDVKSFFSELANKEGWITRDAIVRALAEAQE
jgi:uncharacterized protein (DUF697 family)